MRYDSNSWSFVASNDSIASSKTSWPPSSRSSRVFGEASVWPIRCRRATDNTTRWLAAAKTRRIASGSAERGLDLFEVADAARGGRAGPATGGL